MLERLTQFKLQVKPCKYGRGVFAGKDFKRGELIEICPVIVVPDFARALNWMGHDGMMEQYYFDYDGGDRSCLALGYGSLYNHANNSNAHYEINRDAKEIIIMALRNIKKGNQIYINYGYDPVKRFK